MNMRHLLVPLDGSAWSHTIVPTLCQLLDPKLYHVTLLRVAEEPARGGLVSDRLAVASNYPASPDWQHVPDPVYDTQVEESARGELEDALQLAGQPLRAAGFKVAVSVCFGNPAEEIVATIKAQNVDLVAMTTHGRTGVRRVLMGSVAEEVMHSAEVPVLLLRPTAQPSNRSRTDVIERYARSRLERSQGGVPMDERDVPIKDADANVTSPPSAEVDHNLAGHEMSPEAISTAASRNPFMEIEEETLPEDFRPIF